MHKLEKINTGILYALWKVFLLLYYTCIAEK